MGREYITNCEEETEALGRRLGQALEPGAVIAFTGGLGAGKTAFTRGLARGLGYPGRVTSPTFAIVNEYRGGRIPLFHFDIYRLNGPEDLWDIGFEDYLEQDGGVCVIEWSERAEEVMPEDAVRVSIACHPEEEGWRMITIEGVPPL